MDSLGDAGAEAVLDGRLSIVDGRLSIVHRRRWLWLWGYCCDRSIDAAADNDGDGPARSRLDPGSIPAHSLSHDGLDPFAPLVPPSGACTNAARARAQRRAA